MKELLLLEVVKYIRFSINRSFNHWGGVAGTRPPVGRKLEMYLKKVAYLEENSLYISL
jgi:hypothetical protein